MDKLGGISHIISIIRGQAKSDLAQSKQKISTTPDIKSPQKPKKISKDELKKNLSQKLKSIPKNTENKSRSKDVFLESVILWEFGEQLANDPLFAEIKSKVRQTIESNPETSEKLEKLIDQLSSR